MRGSHVCTRHSYINWRHCLKCLKIYRLSIYISRCHLHEISTLRNKSRQSLQSSAKFNEPPPSWITLVSSLKYMQASKKRSKTKKWRVIILHILRMWVRGYHINLCFKLLEVNSTFLLYTIIVQISYIIWHACISYNNKLCRYCARPFMLLEF